MFLTISQNSWENICARASFLIKFIEKETLAQVFSCAFCEIFKSTFFTEHLRGTASLSLSLSLSLSFSLCVCVFVCLFVRVCVCVCVCVCLYSSTVKASSVCKMSETHVRGIDQRCYVLSIIPGASAKFLHLRIWKCHISPPKMKLLRRNHMLYLAGEMMICFDIGYKSASTQSRWETKRY